MDKNLFLKTVAEVLKYDDKYCKAEYRDALMKLISRSKVNFVPQYEFANHGRSNQHLENIENKDDFGKDKNKVYLFGLELKDVKPEKFQVVKEPITEKIIYVRDENNLFVIFYDYFSGFNFVKTKKIENIDFKTLKWKSAREMEDKNGKYIVNGSVIDEDKIGIEFIKK